MSYSGYSAFATVVFSLLFVFGAVSVFLLESGRVDAATLTKNANVAGGVSVTGALSKGSGTFVIDHPLDPKNKLLYHSFVESPDVKNIYDGVVTLDKNGEATIALPSYFMALNKEFRYLATGISHPMPELHLDKGVRRSFLVLGSNASFSLAGGVPLGTVSWQVTGIRKDPLIIASPVIPEVEKTDAAVVPRGTCLFEPLCE